MQPEIKTPKDSVPEEVAVFVSSTPKKKNKTVYYTVLLSVFNVIVVCAYVFLFGYVLHTKDLIAESAGKLGNEQLKEEGLRVVKESFRNTESERVLLENYFVDSEEIVRLIEEFEKAGKQADVVLTFNYVNIRENNADKKLVLELESVGSFSELFYFLQMIEQIPVRASFNKVVFDKETSKNIKKRRESDSWHLVTTIEIISFDGSKKQ